MSPLTEGKGNVAGCRGGGHQLPRLVFQESPVEPLEYKTQE